MRLIGLSTNALLALCLAGCAALPNNGPSASTIIDRANDTGSDKQGASSPYAVVDISENVVSAFERHKPPGFRRSFNMNAPAPTGTLGVGDIVSVSIYEASSGGLFGTGDLGTGVGTKNVQLPQQQVGRNGTINVPFAGAVQAAGRTPGQVGRAIMNALSAKAIEPQVIVSLVQNTSSVVTVSGEVGQGGRFALSLKGDRVLDAIAEAGGPKAPAYEIYVRLNRGQRGAVINMADLLAQPEENVYLRAGDGIFLYRDPRSFTVLGATGKNADVEFEGNSLTLAEALGKAGGLDDQRSDAAGVFVFRYENACVYDEIMATSVCSNPSDKRVPVVYRLDLKEPSSLLLAQRFYIRDKDVLYISNSPSTEIYKFLQLIGTGVGIAGTGASFSQLGR